MNLPSSASGNGKRPDRQQPHGARWRSDEPPAGRAPADGTATPEKRAPRLEPAAPDQGGGVKINERRRLPFRDATEAAACTVWGPPLELARNGDSPTMRRVCAYPPCAASLDVLPRDVG